MTAHNDDAAGLPMRAVDDSEHMPHQTHAAAAEIAVHAARSAADDAVRSIFELATALEFLRDAIGRFKAESMRGPAAMESESVDTKSPDQRRQSSAGES